MKRIMPIAGIITVIVQLFHLWPLDVQAVLAALVTGCVFYISCKLGWEVQRNQINQDSYKGWAVWCRDAMVGTFLFLTITFIVLFLSLHNPICDGTEEYLFGRCEQSSLDSSASQESLPLIPMGKGLYALLLVITFYIGSVSKRIEHALETKKEAVN